MDLQGKWLNRIDRTLTGAVGLLLGGSLLAFGGAVWWARLAIVVAVLGLLVLLMARFVVAGRCAVVKSPLIVMALLGLALGMVQIVPLPAMLAQRIAPRARAVHTMGVLPDRVLEDDPSTQLVDPGGRRTPATIDRPATLRWLVAAGCCLGVLIVIVHHVSRLDRTVFVIGSIVAVLYLATPIGLIQLATSNAELRPLRVVDPQSGPAWAPTPEDSLRLPGTTTLLRPLASAAAEADSPEEWLVSQPAADDDAGGSLVGGPGGFLALAALGLPLALGLVLHVVAPRGSRLALRERIRMTDQGGLALVLMILTCASAFMAGRLSNLWAWGPIVFGLVVAGLPAIRSGLRFVAPLATLMVLAAYAAGVALSASTGGIGGSQGSDPDVWRDAARIAMSFPALGSGLGSFATVEPYFKSSDGAAISAGSSLLQWWAESGLVGLILLAVGTLICLGRLPGALRRLGRADGPLGFGLLGALGSLAVYSATNWSVELLGIGIAASAVLGLCERWLSGGTDLFVEPASPSV